METWSERGRRVGGHLWPVTWRLLSVVVGLEVLYLLVANLILWTPLLRNFAAQSDDLKLDYTTAYSVRPGRIEVRDLHLRFHDHNVEFSVQIERGTLDVSLHELFQRRFHALRVDGDQVSYRMRHRLSAVGLEGPRVAAYPPIPGFADPPLFVGPPTPPIPDEEYNLWDVDVENVTARAKEIWILEYRYRGPGLARGSFHVRPARYYEVKPTTLELSGGKLTLGGDAVAERVNAHLRVVVAGSDPRRLEGLEPLRNVFADARGTFEGTDLRFLDAYLGPHAGASARGHGGLDFDVHLHRGTLVPGTRLGLRASEAELRSADFALRGEKLRFDARTESTSEGVRGRAELALDGTTLALGERRSNRFGATLAANGITVPLEGSEPPSGSVRLHVDQATALMPLLTPSGLLRDLETALLGLRDLDAYATLRAGPAPLVDLREARAGVARARGYYLARGDDPAGAFLVSTPVANLGLRITPHGSEWSPLVSDDWLANEAARTRGAQGRPGRGRSPRPLD